MIPIQLILSIGLATGLAQDARDLELVRGSRRSLTVSNSMWGPTGLINVPTAYTAGYRRAQVGSGFTRGFRGPSLNFSPYPDVEVGGAFLDRDGQSNKAIANAKVTFRPSNFDMVELGIGVIDAADAIETTAYAMASVDLRLPVRDRVPVEIKLHGGFGSGLFNKNLIGGAEVLFTPRLALIGEWDWRDLNGGLRYIHNESVSLQSGVAKSQLFFGMTYSMRF